MNVLPVYDNRYIKTKIRIYDDKFYTNFHCLNVPEDGGECKYFTIISIDSLLVYENKHYLQLYLNNCIYKNLNTQMKYFFDDNLIDFNEISIY